jgi:hypothetical protein
MENIHDPYDMLIHAHARIDYLETMINNQTIETERLKNQIQILLHAVQVLQDSQIAILEHNKYKVNIDD